MKGSALVRKKALTLVAKRTDKTYIDQSPACPDKELHEIGQSAHRCSVGPQKKLSRPLAATWITESLIADLLCFRLVGTVFAKDPLLVSVVVVVIE